MPPDNIINLDPFYAYGYQGRSMVAVRAPFAMMAERSGLIGRIARIEGVCYEILSVGRQITGPIAAGEPIGVEVRPAPVEAVA